MTRIANLGEEYPAGVGANKAFLDDAVRREKIIHESGDEVDFREADVGGSLRVVHGNIDTALADGSDLGVVAHHADRNRRDLLVVCFPVALTDHESIGARVDVPDVTLVERGRGSTK